MKATISKLKDIFKSNGESNFKLNKIEKLILLVFFVNVLVWIIFLPVNNAPDEAMRYLVPKYIFNHNKLPLPDDPEVVHVFFNASYAYYPLLLGSIISAVFMKIASLWSVSEMGLLIASRLTSLLFGVLFVYFLIKVSKRLFKGASKYFAIILGAFMPQVIFLSSYVNNDIIALASSLMIILAWISFLQDGVNYKNSLLLAVGIIICALSYYSAYGWILFSIIFYIANFIKKEDKKLKLDYKKMFKYGIFIAVIVLIGISYFFVRNMIINNGDMLGMDSFLNACEKSTYEELRPSNRETAKNLGMGYLEMLKSPKWTGSSWFKFTAESFICVLGPMNTFINEWVYIFVAGVLVIGSFGMIIHFFMNTRKKPMEKVFYLCLLACLIIPVLLSIQYSYATDYQAQGRYVYPLFGSLIIFTTFGIEAIINVLFKIIEKISSLILKKEVDLSKAKKIVQNIVYVALILVILYIMLILANRLFVTGVIHAK